MSGWQLLSLACVSMAGVFGLVWAVSYRLNNYGFLDAIWSLSIAILAPMYAVLASGDGVRRWAFAAVGAAWSVRLGSHILLRVIAHHPKEDGRYQTLRKRWPSPFMFFLFFELQALIAVIFSLPFLLATLNPQPDLGLLDTAGLLLAAGGLVGEAISDQQAQRFKSNPANRNAVLSTGLWRYSRHPNYFFESLVWWGFFLAALASPYGWITLCCPLLMLYFLLRVTGIPITEEHSLRNKGEAYRQYQLTTSRFIPLPPRRAPGQNQAV